MNLPTLPAPAPPCFPLAVPSSFTCEVEHEQCTIGYHAACDAATGTRPVSKAESCDYDDPHLSGRRVTHLPRVVEDDYPFPCPPGSLGGEEVAHQISSSCAGPCPSGFSCAARTMSPEECPISSYCPLAAAAPIVFAEKTQRQARQKVTHATCARCVPCCCTPPCPRSRPLQYLP